MKTERIPVHLIHADTAEPRMDVGRIIRCLRVRDGRPIEVERRGKRYLLKNGRHRWITALIAGDSEIEAVVK